MALTRDEMRTAGAETKPLARGLMSRGWTIAVAAAWLVFLPLGFALEPTAAQTTIALWEWVVSYALLGAMTLTAVGLAKRNPAGAKASFIAAGIFTAGIIACPVTGHHALGTWWFGQLACGLAILAVSGAAAFSPLERKPAS